VDLKHSYKHIQTQNPPEMSSPCPCCAVPIAAVSLLLVSIVSFFLFDMIERSATMSSKKKNSTNSKNYSSTAMRLSASFSKYFFCFIALSLSVFLGVLETVPSSRQLFFSRFCEFMASSTSSAALDEHRCDLLKGLKGSVLELGCGPGTNFKCMSTKNITQWVGVEPNGFFSEALEREKIKRKINFPTRIVWKKGELSDGDLDIDEQSFDFVIATHVLCSVDDVDSVLLQVKRALKRGGRFIFLEHTWSPDKSSFLFSLQQFLSPFFTIVGNGCHFRHTWEYFLRDPQSFAVAAAKMSSATQVSSPPSITTSSSIGGRYFTNWHGEVTFLNAPISIPLLQPHIKGWVQKP